MDHGAKISILILINKCKCIYAYCKISVLKFGMVMKRKHTMIGWKRRHGMETIALPASLKS
jgi:hypothetical protein